MVLRSKEFKERASAFWHSPKSENYQLKAKKLVSSWVWKTIRSLFLLGFCFIILYPVLTMVSKSFMNQADLYDNAVIWIPKHFTLLNLRFAWEGMSYEKSFFTSLLLTLLVTVMQTAACLLVGYGFARFEFPLKKLLFVFVICTIIIPVQQIIVPLYLHFRNFDLLGLYHAITGLPAPNLLDSYAPFLLLSATCMGFRNGLFVFLFRQCFRNMPRETEEAALVDGAGAYRTFGSIMLPNAVSVIATVVLFSFVWQWNDTYYSGLFLSDIKTVTTAFTAFNTYVTQGRMYGSMMAYSTIYDFTDYNVLLLLRNSAMLLVMAPLLLMYAFTQRYFVESIDRSGLVG